MKKILYLAIIFCCVLAMPVVAAMKSDSANNNENQNNKSDLSRPIHATDIKIAKKKILSPDIIKGVKDKPETPPGQDKEKKVPVEDAASGILGSALDENANKYAVIVGVCDYPGTVNDLCWSDGDSLNMYRSLIESGYDPDNIYMFRDMDPDNSSITRGPATFENIYNAIMDIKNDEVAGDEIVFFFSGHGASGMAMDDDSERKDESIVVHDGIDNALFIWDGQLKGWFDDFDTSRIIFIFDSCRAEGMNDVMEDGRIVVAGSEETKVGYVFTRGDESSGIYGEGVFTHYFVKEGMLQGLADVHDYTEIDGDEPATVEEAFDYAKENIPDYYRRQTPVINDDFTNDLLLGYHL